MIDLSQERQETDAEVLRFVARNEGASLDTIHRRLHAPASEVRRSLARLADKCALVSKPGRNGPRYYVARMSDTVEDCLVQIRALATRGIMASRDEAPVVDL